MSISIIPLSGIAFPVDREVQWSTDTQESISGKEVRLSYYTYPRYTWTCDIGYLSSASAATFQALMGFYNERQGSADSFLYQDPDDNAVTGQSIATGNGSTAAYQLIKSLGGFIEPVLAPNISGTVNVYLNGTSIPSVGYSAPGSATLGQSSGGALAATIYYVKVAWNTNSGSTLAGTESSVAVSANNILTVAQPASPPVGAISWSIYVSNTAGGGSGAETLQATIAIATISWTEPTSGLIAGSALPSANTTGWSVSGWGGSTPGILTFAGNVLNNIPITADFSYYYPCRFATDKVAFTLGFSQIYTVKKLSWMSVKN